ncbi:glycoside hydrolase family 97 protein [Henriciella sp. AS95]
MKTHSIVRPIPAAFAAILMAAGPQISGLPFQQQASAEATADANLSVVKTSSPDGRTELTVGSRGGQPFYTITRGGEEIVAESRLGLRFAKGADLDRGLNLTSSSETRKDETWEQPWGEKHFVRDNHREVAATFTADDGSGRTYTLRARVFDTGVGFRYEVPDTGERALVDEITEFSITPDGKSWWTPAGEFNRYEYIYKTTPVRDIYRVHTPYTVKLDDQDGPYIAIHEAALVDYAGMWLDQRRAGVLEAELAPRHDGVKVRVSGAFKTPWRVIQIADTAAGLINGSDIYLNLNEPNKLGDTSYFKPGKYIGIWWGMHINKYTWGSGPNHGATTENTKRYMDFAARNGFDGVLVEGWNVGWDGDWFNNGELFRFAEPYPDFDIKEITDYGREIGVQLIGHHETSANIANYEAQLEDAFQLYKDMGVHAVKTGYVADESDLVIHDEDGIRRYTRHDAQERVVHDLKVLERAHAYGIAVNAHEPIKDTGLRRTYPNAVSREGVRGMEFNAWGSPPNPVEHQAILPFTRMLAGPADYTPGIFDLMPNGQDAENRVQTTLAKQLALYVTLYSPLQMAADLPENYDANPEPFQFIRDVPADWENSIALMGEVGDYLVQARQERGSPDWYIGAVTDEYARTVSIPLDFLEDGVTYRAEIYRDGDFASWNINPYPVIIETRAVTSGDEIEVWLARGGGAAIRLVAETGSRE